MRSTCLFLPRTWTQTGAFGSDSVAWWKAPTWPSVEIRWVQHICFLLNTLSSVSKGCWALLSEGVPRTDGDAYLDSLVLHWAAQSPRINGRGQGIREAVRAIADASP